MISLRVFLMLSLVSACAFASKNHRIVTSEQLQIPTAANEVYLLTEVARPKGQMGYLLSHSVGGKIFGQKALTSKLYQDLKAGYSRLPTTTKFGCRNTVRRTSFVKGKTREMVACLDDAKNIANFDRLTADMKELLALQPVRLPASLKLRR